MKKLIIFDVDGVLLDNKLGGFKDVLAILGKEKEVKEIDEEYQKRKHLGPWGLEELAKLYKGFSKQTLKETAKKYCFENLMQGAREVVSLLKARGCLIGALSSNPQFILDSLSEILSIDFVFGTELEFKNDLATGKISKKVDRYIKAEILKEKMGELNLQSRNVIIIGDSLTDIPMAEIAGFFIGFNAKKEIWNKTDIVIKKKDLKEILKYI